MNVKGRELTHRIKCGHTVSKTYQVSTSPPEQSFSDYLHTEISGATIGDK